MPSLHPSSAKEKTLSGLSTEMIGVFFLADVRGLLEIYVKRNLKTLSQTRVRGFEQKCRTNFRATTELTQNRPWGCEKSSGETVSGSALDANGNTLSDPSGKSYTWDFENRLTQAVVSGAGGGTTTYKHDPFGRRIQKSGPLGATNYLYDGKSLVEETDQSGNVRAKYTDVHRDLDEPLVELRSGTINFYQADALGTVTSLSNAIGALAGTYTYDSFGNLTASTGTPTNPFQYTAREFDPETGTYYYRARYYDTNSGRFLGEDPLRFRATIDFYAYALNDPGHWSDPDGRKISLGPIYDWYEKSRNYADLIVCGAKARWCLMGLADSTHSIRDDATIGSPDNPNSSAATGLDQIHAICHSDQNCKALFCGCLATFYTSAIPLAPPSWIGDMFPEPCDKEKNGPPSP